MNYQYLLLPTSENKNNFTYWKESYFDIELGFTITPLFNQIFKVKIVLDCCFHYFINNVCSFYILWED